MAHLELVLFPLGVELLVGELVAGDSGAGQVSSDDVVVRRPAVLKLFAGRSEIAGAGLVGSWALLPFPLPELVFSPEETPAMFPAPELEAMYRTAVDGAGGGMIRRG